MKTLIAVFIWAAAIAAGIYGIYAEMPWLLLAAFIVGFPSGLYWGFKVI